MINQKKTAAMVSIISNSTLILLKLFAGIISSSVSIISEAIHSLSDLLASIIAFFSVSKSEQPPDENHQFGHGKYEDFSGLLEGILIILAGLYIIYETCKHLIFGSHNMLDAKVPIIVMCFSIVVNFFVSIYLYKVAQKTKSLALLADAEHLKVDILTSAAVLIGLFVIKITNITVFDPIIAIIVAVTVINTGLQLCISASNGLLDKSLGKEDLDTIESVIKKYKKEGVLGIKSIRTRKNGLKKNIEFTIFLASDTTIKVGHQICDRIESDIEKKLGESEILIHIEPFCEKQFSK